MILESTYIKFQLLIGNVHLYILNDGNWESLRSKMCT